MQRATRAAVVAAALIAIGAGSQTLAAGVIGTIKPAAGYRHFMPVTSAVYFVFFDAKQSILTPAAQANISQFVADWRSCACTRVELTAHTDRSGTMRESYELSVRMATTVAYYLEASGVPVSQIDIRPRGETQPLVNTPDGIPEPSNRRVELRLN